MSSQCETSTRRQSNASLVRHFYSAVTCINGQRQAASAFRICRYMQRKHGIKPADCVAELELCVRDGLLRFEQTVGKKGSKKGAIQEKYALNVSLQSDGHDWYCFECHKGGEVICCSSCYRVFHTHCTEVLSPGNFSCYVCRSQKESISLTKEKLNRLLGYLCKRIKDLVPNNLKRLKHSELDEKVMSALFFTPMDLYTMQKNIVKQEYNHWIEFAADAKNFLHNSVLYFGEKDTLTQQLNRMLEYCLYDIKEIELCADCYEASNDRTDKLWFCKPCKPLHQLVFAKMEASPFWPAKVIKQFDDKYDVRFFGSRHTRSIISETCVIKIPPCIKYIESLPKYGHTSSWKKAVEELITHVICIGPLLILKHLPRSYDMRGANPNSRRVGKRKVCDEVPGSKKIRCQGNKRGKNKTPRDVNKINDQVRKKIICDNETCDNIMNKNITCDQANSVQEVSSEDIPSCRSPMDISIQEHAVEVPEKTESTKSASHTEMDSESISSTEFHEEIDIKDEYEDEIESDDQTEIGDITKMNERPYETNSEKIVKERVGLHGLTNSLEQRTETCRQNAGQKKDDSLNLAGHIELPSGSVPLELIDKTAIKKKSNNKSKSQMLNKSKDVSNIQNHDSLEENLCGSKHEEEKLEILAESIIVKEESLCLHCSSLDLITRKEAEKIKEAAVANTAKHYVAIIARMQEQYAQSIGGMKKVPEDNNAN